MASASANVNCSQHEDATSVDALAKPAASELALPVTETAAEEKTITMEMEKEKVEEEKLTSFEEAMELDDVPSDPPIVSDSEKNIDPSTCESKIDENKESKANNLFAADADAPELEKSISELTAMENSKKDTDCSLEKLNSDKPIETDLDSSIELISSPIIDETGPPDKEKEVTETTSTTDNTGSLKPNEIDLDRSIELIESPAMEELRYKESSKDTAVDSDSSIELISSPDKDIDDANKNVSNEEAQSNLEDEEQSKSIPHDNDVDDAKKQIQNEDITEAKSIDMEEAKTTSPSDEATPSKAIIEEFSHTSPKSAEDIHTEEQEMPDNAAKSVANEEPQNSESMEVDELPKTNENSCLVELNTDGDTKENLEYEMDTEIYYKKDCLNCNCQKMHKQYMLATLAALNYYKVPRKAHKRQYICVGCYDTAMDMYEDFAGFLVAKQPLLLRNFKQEHADFVALDSSDEEENCIEQEKSEFSSNDLQLIEDELEDAIKTVMGRVEIEDQMAWSKTILQSKTQRIGHEIELANQELSKLQNMADKMHFALYSSCQVVHKHMPALDLYQNMLDYVQVPPAGEIERPPIQLNETYYAVKNKAIASWVSVKVIEFTESSTVGGIMVKSYKIKYLNTPYQMVKTITAKHLAYFEPPPVRLTIGTRVIAYFNGSTLSRGKEKCVVPSAFYPGIIAEPLKQANRFRYLIFYDDGYTQYVQHSDVRLVCLASEKVWEDVHPGSRDFIQKYVEKYSVDRPMVQCTRGQNMNTESNGTWLYARVIDIDCSLVQMQFDDDKNHTEWIYRGSLRLGPVFKETQNALNSANAMQQHRVPRRTEPFIRYTKEMETSSRQVNQQMRAIARKSSSVPQNVNTSSSSSAAAAAANAAAAAAARNTVRHLNNSTIYVDDENRPKGHVVYFTAKRNLPPKMYSPHECSPACLFKIVHRLDSYSPLAKPLLSGWERLVFKQKAKRNVVYRGPCGKSFRNLAEVHMYLRATDNVLNVENFDFTPDLRCLAEYSIDPTIVKEADISKGQEKMAIPLVNYYDNTLPPPCTYAKQRIPTEGVHLNLDEEFLVGCDCEDDCSDKSKCACWQLTVGGVRYCIPNKPIEEIGYQYKRLHEHVPTGIYECNSRCKCKKNCLNRVVQHSLEMKLQVFKTSNRGWGLRCVNDIPKGAFICIYAGHLLTETMANEGGLDAGDEYFADLDYIEVAEQLKEGYESDVEHSPAEEEEDTYAPDPEDDADFTPTKYYQPRKKDKLRASRSHSNNSNEPDSQERAVINFNPNADLDETVRENSVRRLFGRDEAPYIMDAKTTGNLGRYFNHSCAPNLFVQNVFVDTHDLRFPWVAFFSANHIRSGTELTWNYNYEVGVVPGKVLYCQCGATNCRIRLL
ncbi:histone-lysine N-methyltransferase eggless [Drosophila grimshawi]|uniref:GH21540 n=1 Tax=Drosophila grimshawi TaxID=7222 RepID=B4J4D7_DROGR|nr:histone-lysine N-methyltransferase eggless [Drosophila grimshawi]EDW01619.1 GH21540 [Drosophila grimshawi]